MTTICAQNHIEEPNYTQVPNSIIDYWLTSGKLTSNAVLLLLIFCRKIFGWHKTSEFLSISRLVELSGFSKPNVLKCLKSLEENGLIIRINHKLGNEYECNEYKLNIGKPIEKPPKKVEKEVGKKNYQPSTGEVGKIFAHNKRKIYIKKSSKEKAKPKPKQKVAAASFFPEKEKSIEILQSIGLSAKNIESLLCYRFSLDDLQKAIDFFKSKNKTPSNPVGWIILCIRGKWWQEKETREQQVVSQSEENKIYSQTLEKQYSHLFENKGLRLESWNKYILITQNNGYGTPFSLDYTEFGFKDRLMNEIQKRGVVLRL